MRTSSFLISAFLSFQKEGKKDALERNMTIVEQQVFLGRLDDSGPFDVNVDASLAIILLVGLCFFFFFFGALPDTLWSKVVLWVSKVSVTICSRLFLYCFRPCFAHSGFSWSLHNVAYVYLIKYKEEKFKTWPLFHVEQKVLKELEVFFPVYVELLDSRDLLFRHPLLRATTADFVGFGDLSRELVRPAQGWIALELMQHG